MTHETSNLREVNQDDMWLENPWDVLAKVKDSNPDDLIGNPWGGALGKVADRKELRMKADMVDAVLGAAGDDHKARAGYDALSLGDKEGFAMMLASTSNSLLRGSNNGNTLNMMAHLNAYSTAQGALRAAYAAKHGKTSWGRQMAQRRHERKMKKLENTYLKYGGTDRAAHLTVRK